MKRHPILTYLLGVLTSVLILGFAFPAVAAVTSKTIEIFPGISVYVDDQKLSATDGIGNPVEAFTYNGVTYLPVRAVAEAFDKPVYWDAATRSVYIGYHNTGSGQTTAPTDRMPTTTPASTTPTPSPAPVTDSTSTSSESTSRTVYITKTGKKYHYSSTCNGGKYYRSTLQEALSRGLTPCNKCVLN